MSSQRNANITSYFAPNSDIKQTKAGRPISPPPVSRPSNEEDKGKGKRPMSGSPAPISEKRQDTKDSVGHAPQHLSHKDLPPNWLANSSIPGSKVLSLTYRTGDIFAAPPQTLLIHACNTQGAWGSGIALAFKQQYPKAYAIYNVFCTKEHLLKSRPVPTGTALLIPPVDAGNTHWIGCLFTSAKYGKGKQTIFQ
jgi:ADP-ribose 1''-phosphate phosphatase